MGRRIPGMSLPAEGRERRLVISCLFIAFRGRVVGCSIIVVVVEKNNASAAVWSLCVSFASRLIFAAEGEASLRRCDACTWNFGTWNFANKIQNPKSSLMRR